MKKLGVLLISFLIGCGGAEASPIRAKDGAVDIKLAIVEDSIHWCDISAAWEKIIHPELLRVTRKRVGFNLEFDQAHALSRPELLTVENFWNSSLFHYWYGLIPPEPRAIRMVSLPPLLPGPLYGGMSRGHGYGSWFFINGERGNTTRIALITLHELGHILGGCIDVCHPQRTTPNLMCAEDAPYLKFHPELLQWDPICTRNIRQKLRLRVSGRDICVGDCKKWKK